MSTNILKGLSVALIAATSIMIAAQEAATPRPKVKPGLLSPEKATNPAPSGNSQVKTQKNSVGRGKLTVTTAQPIDFWQEGNRS